MIGLLSIAAVVAWIWCCRRIASAVSALAKPQWRTAVAWLGTAILLPLPVIDEVVGAVQLIPYCRGARQFSVDPAKIRGQLVEVKGSVPQRLPRMAIPVWGTRISYRSLTSGEELASAHDYSADGGLLMRLLGGGATLPPLLPVTGEGYACRGPSMRAMAQRYGFQLLEDEKLKR